MGLIEAIEAEGMKENVPQFNVGFFMWVLNRQGRLSYHRGRQRAYPELRRRCYRQEERRDPRDVHCTPPFLRRRCGALLPPAFPQGCVRQRRARRQGSPRKALLSARAYGEGRQDQGKEVSLSDFRKPIRSKSGADRFFVCKIPVCRRTDLQTADRDRGEGACLTKKIIFLSKTRLKTVYFPRVIG